MIESISPIELRNKIENGDDFFILDVRTQTEFKIANIGGYLIPLDSLTSRYQEVPQGKEVVVLCHHGMRSAVACDLLVEKGYKKIFNLTGGLDQWALQVDGSMQRY